MNNFTKTESLPKTGHVNEVCKEWLVREDGALAYKLQSQEITDYYKGNRFRNAVVREDFPTALHEQIKERENADKQSENYRRRLMEQEVHDKCMANEIAEKLERDLQEQQQRELQESEIMAQQMQEIYVNLPPVPPPATRDKGARPPPRPAKANVVQLNANEPSTSNGRYQQHSQHSNSSSHHHHHQQQQQKHSSQPLQLQQQHFSNADGGYVGLSLTANVSDMSAAPQRQRSQQQHHPQQLNSNQLVVSDEPHQPQHFNQFVERSKLGRIAPALTIDNFTTAPTTPFAPNPQHQHRHQHSSSSGASAGGSSASSAAQRRNVFESIITTNTPHHTPNTPTHSTPEHHSNNNNNHTPPSPTPPTPTTVSTHHPFVDELIEYSDVADSIRRYDIPTNSNSSSTVDAPDSTSPTSSSSLMHHTSLSATATASTSHSSNFNRLMSPSHENLLRTDHKFQKLSPEKFDELVGNDITLAEAAGIGAAAERHMQQHADDIDVYVDPCDYAGLQEIGLPMEEIKEMSKKIKQEQKDELLARRLQQMEAHDGLSQEERDRLLAIEAQDKELAKMLQEREKAKAKRAKEKARLRKSQHKEPTASSTLCSTSNGLHCGPLLPLPQDCMSFSTSSSSSSHKHTATTPNAVVSAAPNANSHAQAMFEDPLDMEAYSNPIDIIQNQRIQNGTLTNGSLTRSDTGSAARHSSHQSHGEDDIYTLPVDSCRPGQRPASLSIGPESGHAVQHNSMTRSENYSLESHDSLIGHDISPRMNYSKSGSFDQSSSPTPPYMPIQGTRRSNSSEDRKKKSKDKCTHQ